MKPIYSKKSLNVDMFSGIPPGGILEGQYAGRVNPCGGMVGYLSAVSCAIFPLPYPKNEKNSLLISVVMLEPFES
jgi:hypothetical protein